jgi:hypothetical protein
MVPMHTFAHAIRTLSSIGTLDVDGGKRNVIADASEKAHHAVMAEAVGVERVARIAQRHFNVGERDTCVRSITTESPPRRLKILDASFGSPGERRGARRSAVAVPLSLQRFDAVAFASGGKTCRPRVLGMGADSGHHEHRSPSTNVATDASGVTIDLPQINRPARAAALGRTRQAMVSPRSARPGSSATNMSRLATSCS